jgi:hypothetical protein
VAFRTPAAAAAAAAAAVCVAAGSDKRRSDRGLDGSAGSMVGSGPSGLRGIESSLTAAVSKPRPGSLFMRRLSAGGVSILRGEGSGGTHAASEGGVGSVTGPSIAVPVTEWEAVSDGGKGGFPTPTNPYSPNTVSTKLHQGGKAESECLCMLLCDQ